jgi:hypothetical protein
MYWCQTYVFGCKGKEKKLISKHFINFFAQKLSFCYFFLVFNQKMTYSCVFFVCDNKCFYGFKVLENVGDVMKKN